MAWTHQGKPIPRPQLSALVADIARLREALERIAELDAEYGEATEAGEIAAAALASTQRPVGE